MKKILAHSFSFILVFASLSFITLLFTKGTEVSKADSYYLGIVEEIHLSNSLGTLTMIGGGVYPADIKSSNSFNHSLLDIAVYPLSEKEFVELQATKENGIAVLSYIDSTTMVSENKYIPSFIKEVNVLKNPKDNLVLGVSENEFKKMVAQFPEINSYKNLKDVHDSLGTTEVNSLTINADNKKMVVEKVFNLISFVTTELIIFGSIFLVLFGILLFNFISLLKISIRTIKAKNTKDVVDEKPLDVTK